MWKRLLSYLWPITQKVPSVHNGTLELTWLNGRKLLDSPQANYSYGNLQRTLYYGLSHLEIGKVSSVLLLGLGGGSVIQSLRKDFNHTGPIAAVELDPVVLQLAQSAFGITASPTLQLIEADALHFVEQEQRQFDLIIVDLFIDDKVPEPFYSEGFCVHLNRLLSAKGQLLFNLGLKHIHSEGPRKVHQYFSKQPDASCQYLENVLGTNQLLLLSRHPPDVD